MKRLKNTAYLVLPLLLSLCVISTPALAEHPWVGDDPPKLGLGGDDITPGPRGGGSAKAPVSGNQPVKLLTSTGFVWEISSRLAELIFSDAKELTAKQGHPSVNTHRVTSSKVE